MSTLQAAMPTIILHEGGFSNDPTDPGGATNYGISLRFLLSTGDLDKNGLPDGDVNDDGLVNVADIQSMTITEATHLYDLYWWSKYGYSQIVNQTIATKLLDLSINMGQTAAVKCLQYALRSSNGIQLTIDGVMGPQTIAAINATSPSSLLMVLKSEAAGYYKQIVAKNPTMQKYLKGWLNRAYSNVVS